MLENIFDYRDEVLVRIDSCRFTTNGAQIRAQVLEDIGIYSALP